MKHVDHLIRFVKAAGATSEAATDRNGFLSYHAETHALAMGMAAAFTAVAFNEASLLGIVYGAATHGRIRQSEGKRRRIIADCKQEPHYALTGVVIGGVLAVSVRLAMGDTMIPSLADVVSALPAAI
jgi:hypothetical protein